MSIQNVALVGATGNVGPAVLNALLSAKFKVTILTREGSTSTDSLPAHPNQSISKVDFTSVDSITKALQSANIQAIICNIASTALPTQKTIVDAAIAANVQRFIPSDFGADLDVPINQTIPFNAPKVDVHEHILSKISENPNFSYTFVTCGPFFDWCLRAGIFGDLSSHTATLWDGGDIPFSTTTLSSVGTAVVGILKNPSATHNRTIRIADTTLTQRQVLDLVKSIDGKEWTTNPGDTAQAYQAGLEEFSKPEPNFMVAVMNQLVRIMFCEEFGVDFSGKLDNEVVGLPKEGMSEEELKKVVKGILGERK